MQCRVGCGACCIAWSISSPIPGMPNGKPAGVRCVQLTSDNKCKLFDKPERPLVCSSCKHRMRCVVQPMMMHILIWLSLRRKQSRNPKSVLTNDVKKNKFKRGIKGFLPKIIL